MTASKPVQIYAAQVQALLNDKLQQLMSENPPPGGEVALGIATWIAALGNSAVMIGHLFGMSHENLVGMMKDLVEQLETKKEQYDEMYRRFQDQVESTESPKTPKVDF